MTDQHANKWAVLAITCTAMVLSLTTWFSATAVIPELTKPFDLSIAQGAWLTNAVQIGFVVGALGSSLLSLADNVSIVRLMASAGIASALFNLSILIAPSAEALIAARFFTGIALALIYPPGMKFIATWFQQGRGLAMGAMIGALTLGSALPHLVRGLGIGFDWQPVILVSSLCAFVAALVFMFFLREGPHAFARTKVDPKQLGAIIRNRPVMLANFGYFGHMWELYAMWGWMLAYLSAAAPETSPTLPSLLAFSVIVMGTPSSIIAGIAADRYGRTSVTAFCMAISGLCALFIGVFFSAPLWVLVVIALIWGLTVVADSAQFSALVTELADQNLVGSALAFQMGVGFLITVVTVWLVPVIAETMGSWRWSFLVLVPGPVVGVIAMLILRNDMRSHSD